MANEEISRQFDVIEDKVEKLIQSCKSLEEQNREHQVRIEQLEQELQAKKEAEKQYFEQKNLIRGKIDSLLEKLRNFKSLETE